MFLSLYLLIHGCYILFVIAHTTTTTNYYYHYHLLGELMIPIEDRIEPVTQPTIDYSIIPVMEDGVTIDLQKLCPDHYDHLEGKHIPSLPIDITLDNRIKIPVWVDALSHYNLPLSRVPERFQQYQEVLQAATTANPSLELIHSIPFERRTLAVMIPVLLELLKTNPPSASSTYDLSHIIEFPWIMDFNAWAQLAVSENPKLVLFCPDPVRSSLFSVVFELIKSSSEARRSYRLSSVGGNQ
jgi:hypothetical protein